MWLSGAGPGIIYLGWPATICLGCFLKFKCWIDVLSVKTQSRGVRICNIVPLMLVVHGSIAKALDLGYTV